MLTFLELYQTLLGFVFFKLYTDVGLAYPPPLDTKKDEGGAGVGAYSLQEATTAAAPPIAASKTVEVDGKKVSSKDVRHTIKSIATSSATVDDLDATMAEPDSSLADVDEDFVAQPSTSDPNATTDLHTLKSLTTLPQSISTNLFAPYTFWLSRETSRPVFEFIVRSFGGRIGWPASSGSGSPIEEDDDAITHVIIDRPLLEKSNESALERERRLGRKYIQPQWVADCINAGRILLEETYSQGKTLPPHLSPFGEYEGAYDPTAATAADDAAMAEAEEESEVEEEVRNDTEAEIALQAAAAVAAEDPAALRAAELAAEAAGIDYGTFEKEVAKSQKNAKKRSAPAEPDAEKDMNKMMMSNKKRKLYERMKHGEKKRATEVSKTIARHTCHSLT